MMDQRNGVNSVAHIVLFNLFSKIPCISHGAQPHRQSRLWRLD